MVENYTWKNNHEERESVKPNGEAWTFSVKFLLHVFPGVHIKTN